MRAAHKRLTFEDKFARKYFCEHSRLGYLRHAKRYNNKKLRRILKKEYQGESI